MHRLRELVLPGLAGGIAGQRGQHGFVAVNVGEIRIDPDLAQVRVGPGMAPKGCPALSQRRSAARWLALLSASWPMT